MKRKNTALDFLGIVSPGIASVAKPNPNNPPLHKTLIPGVAAGIVGYKVFDSHPVLGFFGSEAVGQNAYRIYRGQGKDRILAATNIGVTGAGVVGSLMWKNKHPFWGYCLGWAAGVVATSFIEGSNSNKFKKDHKLAHFIPFYKDE